jgi:xylulokinase
MLLGIDLGTSSIKVSVIDSATQHCICTVKYPEKETEIITENAGWAEQSPDLWWEHVQQAILKAHALKVYDPSDIEAIGIAYQMHGLVLVDQNQKVLRNSIIWCDSRAVDLGNTAFSAIGEEKCLSHLLNSPGNFTASKLAWVKQNEPHVFEKIDKVMLPGDFISMKMTGVISTSISALSEGIFWDFKNNELAKDVFNHFGFDTAFIPQILPVFSEHGRLDKSVATKLSLKPSTIVSYKAGDQPNNALSLNVLNPGEVAANGGTSGVIYGISDKLTYDSQSRINTFAHVNHSVQLKRLGVLLCINGTGILNRWVKDLVVGGMSYESMNTEAAGIAIGSRGLKILPFGNGAERMLNNRNIGAHFHDIDFNIHNQAHIFRAVQEGIAFAFRYGLDIMRENGMDIKLIRAGHASMFSSELFQQAFVDSCGVPLELHSNEGSMGAAIGAGIGINVFTSENAFSRVKALKLVEPKQSAEYDSVYQEWKAILNQHLH